MALRPDLAIGLPFRLAVSAAEKSSMNEKCFSVNVQGHSLRKHRLLFGVGQFFFFSSQLPNTHSPSRQYRRDELR